MSVTPFHSRADWGARAPKATPSNIDSEGLTAHYGGDSPWGASADRSSAARFEATTDHNRCATIVGLWQDYHMDGKGWNDIAYNAVVCPHGHRYEGRGPGKRSGANGTNAGNARSCAVVYIAGGSDPLTDGAKLAYHDEAQRFRDPLWRNHSDWKSTSCAGGPIKAWQANGWPRPDSPQGDILPALTNEEQRQLLEGVNKLRIDFTVFQAQFNDSDQDLDDLQSELLGHDLDPATKDRIDMWRDTLNVPIMLREDRTTLATDAAKRDEQHTALLAKLGELVDAVKTLAPAEPTG